MVLTLTCPTDALNSMENPFFYFCSSESPQNNIFFVDTLFTHFTVLSPLPDRFPRITIINLVPRKEMGHCRPFFRVDEFEMLKIKVKLAA